MLFNIPNPLTRVQVEGSRADGVPQINACQTKSVAIYCYDSIMACAVYVCSLGLYRRQSPILLRPLTSFVHLVNLASWMVSQLNTYSYDSVDYTSHFISHQLKSSAAINCMLILICRLFLIGPLSILEKDQPNISPCLAQNTSLEFP